MEYFDPIKHPLCNDIIEEEVKSEEDAPYDYLLSPLEIFNKLDDYVIGQEKAKKVISATPRNPDQAPPASTSPTS